MAVGGYRGLNINLLVYKSQLAKVHYFKKIYILTKLMSTVGSTDRTIKEK